MRFRTPATLLVLVAALTTVTPTAAEPIEIEADRQYLNPGDRSQDRVGKLLWRGGLALSSPDPDFGGISGLLIAPDGQTMTAVTDRGHWITARLHYDSNGWLADVSQARIDALGGLNGAALKGKKERDAESLALLADGTRLVSFEHKHRIWRYPAVPQGQRGVPETVPPPPGLADAPANKGIEALVSLRDGRLLGLTQGRDDDPDVGAYLLEDGRWARLSYPKSAAYKPTGAALLPDGDVILLERRFSLLGGLAARLSVLDAAAIRPGAPLVPHRIAELTPPLTVDNMEGVATRRGPAGETLVYLISDDNFHALQRTLLLMFELAE